MAVKISPPIRQQFMDANGNPAVGHKLFTYAAGSTTKQPTFTDSTGLTANTNPIILDSAGRTPYGVHLTAGLTYKFVLALSTDTDPPGSPIFTEDVVSGVNDTATTTSQWIASGVTPTYISAAQFSLVGDKTADFHVGRRLKFTVTAGTVYGLITVSAYTTLTTVTVVMDSTALDAGLSAVELSILTATGSALPVKQSVRTMLYDLTDNGTARLTTLSGITAQQASDLAAVSAFMGTLLNDADEATARATLGATRAVQADMEAGTSSTVVVSPLVAQHHKSASKAWVEFDCISATPAIIVQYNVGSLTDNAVGDITVNFTTAFSSGTAYVGSGIARADGGSQRQILNYVTGRTATAFRVQLYSEGAAAATDGFASLSFFGDQ